MRFFLIISFSALCTSLFAQVHCNTNRYDTVDIFQNTQLKTDTLVYGYNYDWNGVLDTLGLFVLYPSAAADTATKRPMILMLHGGGFTTGSAKSMKNQAQYFARKGYVAVTIDYRLGLSKDCVPGNLSQGYASYRALQDAHAAGRFMVAHAAEYKVDTAAIFAYGRSAGAVTSLMLQYVTDEVANIVFPAEIPASLGGLHNATNNYTNIFSIKGICSVSGGFTDTSVITTSNLVPTQMFHGTADATVPYNAGYANSCNQFATVYGSLSIKTRIKNLGGVYDFYYQPGGGHGDIYETVDTFFYHHVSQFFKRIFCDNNRQATYEFTTKVEDVNLNCTGANGGTVNTNTTGFCIAGAATLNANGYSTGWGSNYQWQYSADSINWNNYNNAVNPATLVADTINATHWYRLKAGCSYTNNEAYSNAVKVETFPVLAAQANASTVACAGGTATIAVTANGGTAPYNGEGNFEVSAGTYMYTITDANGCSASTEITVTEPGTLAAQANAGTVACAGETATIAVTANGGTAPYNGEGNFEVTAGTYMYTITDANGCSAFTEITVTEPGTLAAQANAGTVACAGETTTVAVTANGGTAPYNGEGNFEVSAGTYMYTITDANGCSAFTEITVTEPGTLAAQANAGAVACAGETATIAVTASGGTAPYNGEGNFEVTAGTYTYAVTDANGCSASTEITVTEPGTLAAQANAGTVACAGETTTVAVTANGGTAPYNGEGNFEVSAGTYMYTITDANGCSAFTEITVTEPGILAAQANASTIACAGGTATIAVTANGGTAPYNGEGNFEVSAGTYTYAVTDANGCSASTEITVTEPGTLAVQANASTIACAGGTATIAVTANGGTAPYNGEGNFEVSAGTYMYTITDANGCSAFTEITVTEPGILAAQANASTIACAGGTTTVAVTANGGTAPYNGEGNFEVTAGTYMYTITDANGCSAFTEITVTEPGTLAAQANAGTVACAGETTTVAVTANGGTAPYNGEGNFEVSAGTYTYAVTDANGCSDNTSITIATENTNIPAKPGKVTGSSNNLCGGGQFSYSVQAVASATFYSWELPPEFSITENNSNSIVVNIPSSFTTSGEIKVKAGNGCGISGTRVLKVFAVAGNVTNKINGPVSVNAYQTNVSYNVNAFNGFTYNWTVPSGATIVSGQGTKKIFVNFGDGAGNVTVTLSNTCGNKKGTLAVTVSSSLTARTQNEESIYKKPVIQPNPVTDKAIIQFSAAQQSIYQIEVKDMLGKICLQQKAECLIGNNKVFLNTSALVNGNYMVTLTCNDKKYHLKMLKVR